jgi:hypothetical protein
VFRTTCGAESDPLPQKVVKIGEIYVTFEPALEEMNQETWWGCSTTLFVH